MQESIRNSIRFDLFDVETFQNSENHEREEEVIILFSFPRLSLHQKKTLGKRVPPGALV